MQAEGQVYYYREDFFRDQDAQRPTQLPHSGKRNQQISPEPVKNPTSRPRHGSAQPRTLSFDRIADVSGSANEDEDDENTRHWPQTMALEKAIRQKRLCQSQLNLCKARLAQAAADPSKGELLNALGTRSRLPI